MSSRFLKNKITFVLISVSVVLIIGIILTIKITTNNYSSETALSKTGKKTPTLIPGHISPEDIEKLRNEVCEKYGKLAFQWNVPNSLTDEKGNIVETTIMTMVNIPDSIRIIVGLKEGAAYKKRHSLTDSLSPTLSEEERLALLSFLHKRIDQDKLKGLRFNAIKNQVTMALVRQLKFPQELPLHLVAMYYEKNNIDPVWRDYCIQFLGQIYKNISSKKVKLLVNDTLFNALKYDQNIAGAAIIAIDGLAGRTGFPEKKIAEAAYKLATSVKASYIVKIPALQIAAKYHHPKALNLARKFLSQNNKTSNRSSTNELRNSRTSPVPVILKMSAIATLGTIGNSKDLPLIKRLAKNPDIRIRTAARAALKKIEKK